MVAGILSSRLVCVIVFCVVLFDKFSSAHRHHRNHARGAAVSCEIGPSCLDALRPITVTIEDSFWASVYPVNNPLYNRVPPRLVFEPRDEADIMAILQCAVQTGTTVAIKDGGHNYAGFSAGDGNGWQVNLRTHFCTIADSSAEFGVPSLRVGAGCIFQDVFEWLLQNKPDYLLAGGFCPTVGVSGFHLGGGIGALTRLFGMGVDNVLAARVVLANGTSVVQVGPTLPGNTTLFWGLRGGAGGSLGVVSQFVFQVHANPSPAYSYGEYCPPDGIQSFNESLRNLTAALPNIPNWLTLSWRFTNQQSGPTYGLCYLYYSANTAQATYAWLQSNGIIPISAGAPLAAYPSGQDRNGDGSAQGHSGNFLKEFPTFWEMEQANAKFKGYERIASWPYISTNCAVPTMNQPLIDALLAQWITIPNSSVVSCNFQGLPLSQGVAGSVPTDATAFAYRNYAYASDAECDWTSRAGEAAARPWLNNFIQRVSAVGACSGSYVNFPWRGISDFAQRYWGSNLARLSQVRAQWNPSPMNPLRFEQQIPLPI